MVLKVYPLNRILELEGTRGSAIPYLGYVEVNLQIPGIKGYNEDVLLLVIPTMPYSEKVLVMMGSKIIGRAMGMIRKGELARATMTWKQANFSVVMLRSLQLPHKCARGTGMLEKGLSIPSLQTLPCLRNSLWTMSRGMSTPHGGSPFPCLGLSTYMAAQTPEGIAYGSTCLPGQHGTPSFLLLWF